MRRTVTATALIAILSSSAFAQSDVHETEQADFRVATLVEQLEFPWGMAFLPNGDMLISEKSGRLRYVEDGNLRDAAVTGLPDIHVENQGGLLGLALHPDFADNRYVYFAFSEGTSAANHTALGRGRLSADGSELTDTEVIFRVNFEKRRGFHFGGRVTFLADDSLMLTLGDGGGHRDESQNTANHIGTVVRLNDDGSVPFDNPFVDDRTAMPEIYSYGHRNIQGIAINPETGSVWTHEHGARGGDEINIVEPGLNYGWPAVTYGINYDGSPVSDATSGEGFEEPIWYWVPSIAPSGMAFYSGDQFPAWQGDVFVGALAGSMLVRYEVDGDRILSEEPLLEDLGIRVRDVQTGPDGYLYVLTDDLDGQLLRLEPVTP